MSRSTFSADAALLWRIVCTAESIIDRIIDDEGENEDHACVLCVTDFPTDADSSVVPHLTWLFGKPNPHVFAVNERFARQKAESFIDGRPRGNSDTLASAIRIKDSVVSICGFSVERNEAALLMLALNTGEIDIAQATRLAHANNNRYFRELQAACAPKLRSPLDRFQFVDEKHP
jgi:hypothetical protein